MGRILRVLLVCVAIFFLFVSCDSKKNEIVPSGRVVKVGVMGPMKGAKKALGISGLEGIETALTLRPLLNNGDRIELVVEDDGGTPQGAREAFIKLVGEGVAAVLMLSSSPCALEINALADKYKVPVIAVLATHPGVAKGTRFVSQLCFDNEFQGKVAALFVRDELLIGSAAVFMDAGNPYSSSLAREFVEEFKAVDGVVTDVVSLESVSNLKKVLEKVRQHGPKLLYIPISTREALSIIKMTREMNWHPEFMSGDGLLADVLSKFNNEEEVETLEGVMAIDFYSDTILPTRFGRRVKRRFRSMHKKRLTSFSALGVEALRVLQAAMNGCPNPRDRLCVNERIRHTRNVEGVIGVITILPNGKAQRPLVVNKIQSGKIKGMVEVY